MRRDSPRTRSLDGRVRWLADRLGFFFLWGWIVVSLFSVPALLGVPWLGVALGLVGCFLCWQAAEAYSHPITTVGTRREVRRAPIRERGVDCDECGRPAGGGERRRYVTRKVLFGTTVAVPEWGENWYCERCVDDPAPTFDRVERGSVGDEFGPVEDEFGSEDSERDRPVKR